MCFLNCFLNSASKSAGSGSGLSHRLYPHRTAWAVSTEPGTRAAQPSPGLTCFNMPPPWGFARKKLTIFTIYSEHTSIYYLPHGLFHGSRIITGTELKTQSLSQGSYSLAALDPNAFQVKVQPWSKFPWRLFCWGSSQKIFGWMFERLSNNFGVKCWNCIDFSENSHRKILHIRIFSSYRNCAGFKNTIWFGLFYLISFYLFVCSSCFHYFIAHHHKHMLETHLELV